MKKWKTSSSSRSKLENLNVAHKTEKLSIFDWPPFSGVVLYFINEIWGVVPLSYFFFCLRVKIYVFSIGVISLAS